MKILAVTDSPGSADLLRPAWPLLAAQADARWITRVEAADSEKIYRDCAPDLVVAGVSSLVLGPYFLNDLVKLAAADGRPVIALQDYWANHRAPLNKPMLDCWTAVLVPDQLAHDYLAADGYRGKIIITGHPGWEKCQRTKKPEDQSPAFTLLWAGGAAPTGEEIDALSFNLLLDAIAQLNPKPDLLATPHPRDENPSRYGAYLSSLPTDELMALTDVVVATYSTSLIHAALMQIPAVSLMLPEAGQKKLSTINLDDFPLNTVGASIGVYENEPAALAALLIKLRDDPTYRQALAARQQNFAASLPTHAAQNIAREILAFKI